jgi:hypothetical protein
MEHKGGIYEQLENMQEKKTVMNMMVEHHAAGFPQGRSCSIAVFSIIGNLY